MWTPHILNLLCSFSDIGSDSYDRPDTHRLLSDSGGLNLSTLRFRQQQHARRVDYTHKSFFWTGASTNKNSFHVTCNTVRPCPRCVRKGISCEEPISGRSQNRKRVDYSSTESDLASDPSDRLDGFLSGWDFLVPEIATTEAEALPVLSFSDTDFSHVMFNHLMNPNEDVPTPPSISCPIEEDNIMKVKFKEAGIDTEDHVTVWKGINETIEHFAKLCTIEQKKKMWDTFRQSLEESIKSADSVEIPILIWGKFATIYHINKGYADNTGFPYGDPSDSIGLFDITQSELIDLNGKTLPNKNGTTMKGHIITTVKRDIFGLPEYFISHAIFDTPKEGLTLEAEKSENSNRIDPEIMLCHAKAEPPTTLFLITSLHAFQAFILPNTLSMMILLEDSCLESSFDLVPECSFCPLQCGQGQAHSGQKDWNGGTLISVKLSYCGRTKWAHRWTQFILEVFVNRNIGHVRAFGSGREVIHSQCTIDYQPEKPNHLPEDSMRRQFKLRRIPRATGRFFSSFTLVTPGLSNSIKVYICENSRVGGALRAAISHHIDIDRNMQGQPFMSQNNPSSGPIRLRNRTACAACRKSHVSCDASKSDTSDPTRSGTISYAVDRPCPQCVRKGIPCEEPGPRRSQNRRRADDPYTHFDLTSEPSSDQLEGCLSGWDFFDPENAATSGCINSPVLSFSDSDYSHIKFNQLLNATEDIPTPPSISHPSDDKENIMKMKFQEAGIDMDDNTTVWKGIHETIDHFASLCTTEQKRKLWNSFRQSLEESIKSAASVEIPVIIWGKYTTIYYINKAYADTTGFPWGAPDDSINLLDIIAPEFINLVRDILPQIFINRDVTKFQINGWTLPNRDGTPMKGYVVTTVKRDVFGLPEYFISHAIFESPNRGLVLIRPNENPFISESPIEPHRISKPKSQSMTNGILSSHDVTTLILRVILEEKEVLDVGGDANSRTNTLTVDTFTDLLDYDDLLAAIERKSARSVRFLVSQSVELTADPVSHLYLQHRTPQRIVRDILRELLRHPQVDPSRNDNWAIFHAAKRGHAGAIRLLLSDPRVDPSARDNEVIIRACMTSSHRSVELLLSDPRVDPSTRRNNALHYAITSGHLRMAWVLLDDLRLDPTAFNNEVFTRALSTRRTATLKLLLSHPRADPAAGDNTAIRDINILDCLAQLLLADNRVDPSSRNNEAIRNACLGGSIELVQLLLEDCRADPSSNNNEAIRNASGFGDTEIVRLLLGDSRVDPSAENNEALVEACCHGHQEIVELLLAHPSVNPSVVNDVISSHKLDLEAFRLLLNDPRVDPSVEDNKAIRSVFSQANQTEIARLLLSHPKVDPSARDDEALRIAARRGQTDMVRLLLEDPRVDPTANDNEAMQVAIYRGHTEIVKLLSLRAETNRTGVFQKVVHMAKDIFGKIRFVWRKTYWTTIAIPSTSNDMQEELFTTQTILNAEPIRLRNKTACAACRKSHVSCDANRPCPRCIRKGIPCEQPTPGHTQKRRRADDPFTQSDLTSDPSSDLLDDFLTGWNFFVPDAATTTESESPVLDFSDTESSRIAFDHMMNPITDVPTPPSITYPLDDNFMKRKFQEAGIDVNDNVAVWKGIHETIEHFAKLCTIEQKKKLWNTFRQSLEESIRNADSVEIPVIIWGKFATIYYINKAYADTTGFPSGVPGDNVSLFDIIQPDLMNLVRKLLPQIFLNRDINKFQLNDEAVPNKEGKLMRGSVITTIKRDVFGLPEYFVGHAIFESPNRGLVLTGQNGNPFISES
ncbi:ankyrin-2-like [Planoprotostelium fungivorum]|uniref:Ankyrin-2-like n=1 Tax=Planoprotostelium fungivorum TaxID=1890364 RepID=A0A2P6NM37_9EUKA|nr:ankyrin-2-like [Planoprotostelium fungivorum]